MCECRFLDSWMCVSVNSQYCREICLTGWIIITFLSRRLQVKITGNGRLSGKSAKHTSTSLKHGSVLTAIIHPPVLFSNFFSCLTDEKRRNDKKWTVWLDVKHEGHLYLNASFIAFKLERDWRLEEQQSGVRPRYKAVCPSVSPLCFLSIEASWRRRRSS